MFNLFIPRFLKTEPKKKPTKKTKTKKPPKPKKTSKTKKPTKKKKPKEFKDYQTIDSICNDNKLSNKNKLKVLEVWLKPDDFNLNDDDRRIISMFGLNRQDGNKTLLTRQCEQNHVEVVDRLLKIPEIEIREIDIAATEDNELKSKLTRAILSKQLGSSSSKSANSGGEEKVREVREECGHYSINQGQIGSCYIVSVITLFRNEKSILKLLKLQPKSGPVKKKNALKNVIDLLETQVDFSSQCPKLPDIFGTHAITQNDGRTRGDNDRALTKNGGSPYTIMIYIINIIRIVLGEPVFEKYDKQWALSGVFPHGALAIGEYEFQKDTDSKIGYIDIECKCGLFANDLTKLEFFCQGKPSIKGFIFQVVGSDGNHVIAACICDEKIHICNSWSGGCQTDLQKVVNDLNSKNYSFIHHIAFLLTKNIDDSETEEEKI